MVLRYLIIKNEQVLEFFYLHVNLLGIMKILLPFLLAILLQGHLLAQNENDSPKDVWFNENITDSNRTNTIYNLVDSHLDSGSDSALYWAEAFLKFAQQNKDRKAEAEAYFKLAEVYFELGEFVLGEVRYYTGLEIAGSLNDSLFYAKKLFDLGILYYDYEDYANAYKTFQESREVCRLAEDSINEAWSIGYTGLIYLNLENWKEAEKYFLEHLQLSRKYNDKYGEAGAKGNLGGVYERSGDLDKAIEYWKAGIRLAKKEGEYKYASIGTLALIRIYIAKEEYENAIKYLDEYREVTKEYEDPLYSLEIKLYQCKIDCGLAMYSKALDECNQCIDILKNHDDPFYKKEVFKSLYEINKKLNRTELALAYFEKYEILDDSLRNDQSKKEIQGIIFTSRIARDSIAQAKANQLLNASYAEDMRRKDFQMNFSIVIGIMVIILAIGMYHRLRFVRKAKEKLDIEKKRAEKSEQVKQDFLANMSHEIRTPMNAILGMTNLVLDMKLDEKQSYYLNGIKKSGDNLLHIINDILDLSKIEAGKMDLDEIDFSLKDMVDQVIQMLTHRAKEKDITLLCTIDQDVPDIVIGDPMRLNQVLVNLIGNAIKFTPKGSVTLDIRNTKKGVKFNIIDTGIGIPEDKIQTIFETFSQANSSDTRIYGGTGLGLSISQYLISKMNGTIDVESKEGYGTTFTFTLKFKKGSMKRILERIAKDDPIDGSILDGLKILLVDDNEYNIIVARDTLKSKAKLEVYEAYNGEEAIQLVRENEFDVILMDVQMPVMNGFDATKFIRANFESPKKDIPIIALTASVMRVDLDNCIDSGMNSYIPKPFKTNQLIGEIAAVLSIPLRKVKEKVIRNEVPRNDEITNLDYLSKFCEGDESRMDKYVQLFISSSPPIIEKINLALTADDFEEIANQVHGYKTKCIMMGMSDTKELANSIEQLCRKGSDASRIKENVLRFISHIDKALIELNNFSIEQST